MTKQPVLAVQAICVGNTCLGMHFCSLPAYDVEQQSFVFTHRGAGAYRISAFFCTLAGPFV